MGILIQAQIESISSRKDKTVKLVIGTNELPNNKAGELFSMQNSIVNLYLSNNPIQDEMMKEIDKISIDTIDKEKSPSKRLKAVFFILWNNTDKKTTFDEYYKQKMEQLIEHFKNKIKELEE
jgi:hypothetical protein